jgi:transposase-like protein
VLTRLSGNVISLYAKGMTTGDIHAYLAEIYGTEISRDTISRITDAIVEDLLAWQNRPLDCGRFLAVVANHGVGASRR